MSRHINRRGLLRASAAVGSGALLAQPLIGSSAFADYAVAPARRRAASTLAANSPILVGYQRAIRAMKALPASDPCSWVAQAAIHSPGMGGAGPCNHGSLFWAWHRMYLYWFERIVRHKSGMYDWALPYWDYAWEGTPSTVAQRQIPAPFRITASQLYDPTRNAAMNNGTGSLSIGATGIATGLAPTSYMAAQLAIDGTPHGAVHGAVGGNMWSFSTTGLDPLFWLHHCQVDRLWNLWLAKGGGRSSPIGDAVWRNTQFTFYNECCDRVVMTACEVLQAAQQLSYAYEIEPAQVNQTCPRRPVGPLPDWHTIFQVALAREFVLEGGTQRLPLVGAQDRETSARLATLARNPRETVALQLKGVEADRHPGAMWEVYVGLPARGRAVASSPHFVGNVAMFGNGIRGEGHHPGEFSFPLNRALAASNNAAELDVTFVPASGIEVGGRALPPEIRASVRVGEMSLAVDGGSEAPQQQ